MPLFTMVMPRVIFIIIINVQNLKKSVWHNITT